MIPLGAKKDHRNRYDPEDHHFDEAKEEEMAERGGVGRMRSYRGFMILWGNKGGRYPDSIGLDQGGEYP